MKGSAWLRVFFSLFITLACVAEASDQTDEELAQRFREVYSSRQSRSFTGDFIYLRDGQIETFRVSSTADVDGVTEQIEVLNRPDRVGRVFSLDEGVFNRRVIFPARRGVILQWPVIEQSYQLKFHEDGLIAGRKVLTVDIQPNQPDRYGYRVAIDQQTGLQLDREVYNCQQRLVEKMMFVDITLLNEVALAQAPTKQAENSQIVGEDVSAVQVDLARLPLGFKLKRHEVGQGANLSAEHFLFSDELVMISVYLEPVQPEWVPRYGQLQVGAISVVFQPLGEYEMLLLGELPMETLIQMATGFTLRRGVHD